MVTCFSCIASKRADCTLDGALFISSANTKFAKIGPFLIVKSLSRILYIIVPTTSAGSKSGVNCILENSPCTASDSVLIAKVFASPGTPSNRICPFPNNPMMALLISRFNPKKRLFWVCILSVSCLKSSA